MPERSLWRVQTNTNGPPFTVQNHFWLGVIFSAFFKKQVGFGDIHLDLVTLGDIPSSKTISEKWRCGAASAAITLGQAGSGIVENDRSETVATTQAGAINGRINHNPIMPPAPRGQPSSVSLACLPVSVLLYIVMEALWHMDLETENLPEVFRHDFLGEKC